MPVSEDTLLLYISYLFEQGLSGFGIICVSGFVGAATVDRRQAAWQ
jgi:hypothetical protein